MPADMPRSAYTTLAAQVIPAPNASRLGSNGADELTRTRILSIIGSRQSGAIAKRSAANVIGPAYARAILVTTQL